MAEASLKKTVPSMSTGKVKNTHDVSKSLSPPVLERCDNNNNDYDQSDINQDISNDYEHVLDYEEDEGEIYEGDYDQGESTAAYSDGVPTRPPNETSRKRPVGPSPFSQFTKKIKSSDVVGNPVDVILADLANQVFLNGVDEARAKELRELDHMQRPENCESLKNVKVDLPIWNRQDRETQIRDMNFQKLQKTIASAGCGLVNLLEKLSSQDIINSDKDRENILDNGMDILATLGNAHHSLCIRRRELLKSNLAPEYRAICAASNPVSDTLFGDDIDKTIDSLTKTNQVANKVAPPRGRGSYNSRYQRGNNYNHPRPRNDRYNNNYRGNRGRGRGNFRGTYTKRPDRDGHGQSLQQ